MKPLDCVGFTAREGTRGKSDFRPFDEPLTPKQVARIIANHENGVQLTGVNVYRQLDRLMREREWQPMETAPGPRIESGPFLVLVENEFKDPVALQVRWFQGDLYPDHLGGNICWEDRVEGAKGWMPTPAMPRQ